MGFGNQAKCLMNCARVGDSLLLLIGFLYAGLSGENLLKSCINFYFDQSFILKSKFNLLSLS